MIVQRLTEMFRVAIIASLLALGLSLPFHEELDEQWSEFKAKYKKVYNDEDEVTRRMIWEENLDLVNSHNFEADNGKHSYTLAMNKFGDLTSEEFTSMMNGLQEVNNVDAKVCTKFEPPSEDKFMALPDEVDWRKEGYVTKIKDQGECGSCWSFSATGSLEGQHFNKTGTLVELSEKNLMDCSKPEGNKGCKGGLMDKAFAYVIKNKGIDTEKSYPYKAKDGPCEFKTEDIGAVEVGCKDITEGSEDDLKSAVAMIGPISVGIDASKASFQFYFRGIYDEKKCSTKKLDHGVLAAGYGTKGKNDYWLVKNSWGTDWGIDGYIMMSRNKDNQCGIATQASFPTM